MDKLPTNLPLSEQAWVAEPQPLADRKSGDDGDGAIIEPGSKLPLALVGEEPQGQAPKLSSEPSLLQNPPGLEPALPIPSNGVQQVPSQALENELLAWLGERSIKNDDPEKMKDPQKARYPVTEALSALKAAFTTLGPTGALAAAKARGAVAFVVFRDTEGPEVRQFVETRANVTSLRIALGEKNLRIRDAINNARGYAAAWAKSPKHYPNELQTELIDARAQLLKLQGASKARDAGGDESPGPGESKAQPAVTVQSSAQLGVHNWADRALMGEPPSVAKVYAQMAQSRLRMNQIRPDQRTAKDDVKGVPGAKQEVNEPPVLRDGAVPLSGSAPKSAQATQPALKSEGGVDNPA